MDVQAPFEFLDLLVQSLEKEGCLRRVEQNTNSKKRVRPYLVKTKISPKEGVPRRRGILDHETFNGTYPNLVQCREHRVDVSKNIGVESRVISLDSENLLSAIENAVFHAGHLLTGY